MSNDKIWTAGHEVQEEAVLDVRNLTPYRKLVAFALVEMQGGIEQLLLVMAEGTFKPGHLRMLRLKLDNAFAQLEVAQELYPDTTV